VTDDDLLDLQPMAHAASKLPGPELVFHYLETTVEPRSGSGNNPAPIGMQKNGPGIQVPHGFGQSGTGAMDEAQGILFRDNQLVDITDGEQHLFDMMSPCLIACRAHHQPAVIAVNGGNSALTQGRQHFFGISQPTLQLFITDVMFTRHDSLFKPWKDEFSTLL
jgi:hypothetical protein